MQEVDRQTWQQFEEVVALLHRKFHSNAAVKHNDQLPGRLSGASRQIDVSIRYKLGPNDVLMIVECKRYSRKVDIEKMHAFVGKKEDVGAHVGIIVSEKGFTKGARGLAEAKGINAYTLRDTRNKDWPGGITILVFVESVTLEVVGWKISHSDGRPWELKAGDSVDFVDKNKPNEGMTFDGLIRTLWRNCGKHDGEQTLSVRATTDAIAESERNYNLEIAIRAVKKRFSREASLEPMPLRQ